MRTRKLHSGHFAFMRAAVQGLDLQTSWDRYLPGEGEGTDRRAIRSTLAWIREEFATAAKREHRPGTARLVLLDAQKITEDAGPPPPSLENFARLRGLDDFSQAEQLAAYQEEFGKGSDGRGRRRASLIERQLAALVWLETTAAEPPRAADPVDAWLAPALSKHLMAAGVLTLAQLAERINGIGRHWHGGIRALGAAKAARIETWLKTHEASLGLKIGAHVSLPRSRLYRHELRDLVPTATAVRPLEKFRVPAELSGAQGRYRRPQAECLLNAKNDYEAVLAWIRGKHGLSAEEIATRRGKRRQRDAGIPGALDWLSTLSHTQRAYRKEAERFLLWAVLERGKALSSMTQEDCVAYRDFLANPQPRSTWCGVRSRERWSPLWRPFEGPLSSAAQRQALTILKNLYGFLVDQNYLIGNPWRGVQGPRGAGPRLDAGRSFSKVQWQVIEAELETLPATSTSRRLALALHLLYATGLRISEAVAARCGDLQPVSYPADADDDQPIEGWMLRVVGKGGKPREVPVPEAIVELAQTALQIDDLTASEHVHRPLLGKAQDLATLMPALLPHMRVADSALAPATLYAQLKGFFKGCAATLTKRGEGRSAARFEAASTHWLRHTYASHAIAGGMPIEIAQQNLGHASLATTTVYVTTEKKRRVRAQEEFWAKR